MFAQSRHPYAEIVQNYRPLAEFIPKHWQTGSILAPDGTRIHYTRTGGDKPKVLLLHGIQVNGLTWLRTAQALEARYDVVMPDFRGHGKSGGIEHGFSAALLVQDMIALINALGLEKPLVVGHSMGADIAARLAAAHPVRAVVLVDPALQNFAAAMPAVSSDDAPPPWMTALFEAMRTLKTQPHAERMLTGLRLLPPGAPMMAEVDYVAFIDGQSEFDLGVYSHINGMGYLIEAPEVIAQIVSPMLLLTARPMMPGANIQPGVEVFEKHWRDGQHIHFENSGHFIMGEQFERFMEVLQHFFTTH